jgi:PAS domain S-box-containing protein
VDLHAADEWARVGNRYSRLFSGEGWPQFECRLTAADGSLRTVLVSGTRVEFEDSEAVMLEYLDLTEQRSVQQALRAAEERLGTVISSAPIVLFVIDANGVFTLSEGKGLEALGLKAGEVVGRSAFDMYQDVPVICENLRRVLSGEAFTVTVEVGELAFETHHQPILDADGRPDGALGVAFNVTERQHLEHELRHAQKMEAIGRLAGGVAHDFNNLLAAILGHAELMLIKLGDHPARRYAEEIQKAGTRGALLTRQLLAFSRKEMVTSTLIDLGQLVAEASKSLRRLIGDGITLEVGRTMAPTPIHGDRGQIEQVLTNLVMNSREAMPNGGRITIEVGELELSEADSLRCGAVAPGPYVSLAVNDTGCGMDAVTRTRIFEPFFTTKETGRGSGLGLAIVYAIVRRSGGGVEVESTPGEGTTFRIFLPRAAVPEAPLAAVGLEPRHRKSHETILLVEDEDAVREAVREALVAAGFHVIEAGNGEDALQRAAEVEYRFDLLVSDVVMPRMPGTEVLRRLRVHRPDLRVLFVSGYTDSALVQRGALEQGVVFLQKPCSLTAIVSKVGEILDSPEARRPAA